MINLKGNFNNAKIFTNNIEEAALNQIKDYLDNPISQGLKIRIMPDVHVGYDVPIGYTQTITNKIIPNFVGVDIGCGMLVTKFSNDIIPIDFRKLDQVIKDVVPSGFKIFNKRQDLNLNLNDLIAEVNIDRAFKSVGTLGGGNHFIEVNRGKTGTYLVIHSGSRHLGVEVNKFWSKKVPKQLGYLENKDFDGYLNDMRITQKFASLNRKRIRDNIFKAMGFNIITEFESVHNYIDLDKMILRKGATSADLGQKLLIPINMRDGSLLCEGLGNPDWNYSAPHGAGRIMSRTEAKKNVTLDNFKASMEGIYSTSVSTRTLDESPFVYKDMKEIIANTKQTIKVLDHLKPLYNYKA